MAKYSNTIEYNLKTNVDISGISKFQAELTKINQSLDALGRKSGFNDTINKQIKSVETLQAALSKAFDPSLGMMNVRKFQSVLASSGTSIASLQKNLTSIGPAGSKAFNQALFEVGKLDTQVKTTSSTVDKMFNTLGNTVRWHLTASLVQNFSNEIRRAVDYIKELDTSLNQIRIVTNATNAEMAGFAQTANDIAKSLGAATTSFTDAALMYAQNGYIMEDYTRLAELTVRTSNVTGQNAATTSEQITSLINGYKMSIDEAESALDKMALVAAQGASDLNELATAEQKVAASANMLGVSQDQLISQISTIISVTRQAPESVGNALKTIYARLGDLKMGETLEDGINLGKVSGTLEKLGVEVLDQTGNLRNMGEIIEDLMDVWNGLTEAQRQAAAVTLAGKHQYTNLIALLDNQEMYQRQLQLTASAEGTLAQQQAIYLDSYTARLQKLKTTGESIISDLFSVDAGKPFLDLLQNIADAINTIINAVGGGLPVFTALFSLMTKTFSGNIGKAIQGFVSNKVLDFYRSDNERAKAEMLRGFEQQYGEDVVSQGQPGYYMQQAANRASSFSNQERVQYNKLLQDYINADYNTKLAQEQVTAAERAMDQYEQDNNVNFGGRLLGMRESLGDIEYQRYLQQAYGLNKEDYLNTNGTPTFSTNLGEVASTYSSAKETLTKFFNTLEKEGIIDLSGAKAAIAELRQQEGENETVLNSYEETIEKALKDGTITFEDIKNQLETDMLRLTEQSEELEAIRQTTHNASNLSTATMEYNNAKNQQDQLGNQLKTFLTNIDISKFGTGVTQTASGLSSLAFSIMSIQNLSNIWNNENLSSGEKFLQIISNVGMTLPMVINGFTQMKNGLDKIKEGFTLISKAEGFSNLLTTLSGSLTAAAANGSKFAIAMEEIGVTAALSQGTVAGLTAAITPLLPVILGVGAAVGLLGLAVYETYQYLTRFDRAVEDAQEAVNNANARYQDSVEKLNNLQTSLDNIKNADDTFDGLTKGTVEWTEALVNANDQVLNLLDNYPELLNYITVGENGNLTLTEEGFDVARASQLASLGNAITARTVAQQTLIDAERDRALYNTTTSLHMGLSQDEVQSLAEYLVENPNASAEEISSSLPTLNLTIEQLQTVLQNNTEALIELGNKLLELNTEEESLNRTSLQAFLATRDEFNELNAEGQAYVIDQMSSDEANQKTEERYNYYRNLYEQGQLEENGYAGIAGLYSEVMGVDATAGDYGFINVENENGEIVPVSYEEAFRTIAETESRLEAISQIDFSNIEQLSKAIEEINSQTDMAVFGLDPSKGFELTQQGYLASMNALREDGSLTEEDISQIFGEGTWEAAGYASAEEFLAAWAEAINNFKLETPDITDNYTDEEITSLLEQAKISRGAYDAYTEDFYEQYGGAGQYGAEGYIGQSAQEYFRQQDEDTQRQLDELERLYASDSGAITEEQYERRKEELEDLLGAEEAYKDSLEDLATAALETELGIDGLNAALKDNIEILGAGEAAGTDYWNALDSIVPSLGQIFNIDPSTLSMEQWSDFVQANLSEIQRAAEGDEDAIIALRAQIAQPLIASFEWQSELDATSYEDIQNEVNRLIEIAGDPTIEVGTSLDTAEYVAGLNEMLETGQASVDEVQSLLGGIGYDVEIGYTTMAVPDIEYISSMTVGEAGTKARLNEKRTVHYEKVPYVRTVTKNGGGGSGYRPSSSGGGGRGGGGGGGKGGGGGGKGSSYTPKEMDTNKYEEDRYERVNAELDRTTNELSKLADEQDRLTGDDLNKNLEKQVNLIQQQIKWQEEKLKIQKQEAKEYRDQLAGYGILFNDEGTITNYSKIWNKLNSEHERLVKQYNATTTEEGQKALEEEIKQNEEKLENFEDLIDKYDDLVQNQIKDTEEAIQELYNKIEDIQTDIIRSITEAIDESHKQIQDAIDFDYNIDFSLDTDDARTELAKLQDELTALTDSASTNTIATIYAQQIEDLQESISKGDLNSGALTADQKKFYNEKIKELKQSQENNPFGGAMGELFAQIDYYGALFDIMDKYGSAPVYGNNRAALEEDMQKVVEQMYKYAEEERKLLDDITKARVDIIKQAGDAIKEEDDLFKRQTDTLDYYKDLAEKLYGESAYDEYAAYYETSLKNYQEQASMLYQTLQFLTQYNEELKAQMENLDKESYAYKALQKEQKALEEQMVDTTEKYRDAVLKSIDVIFEKYEKTIDKIQDGVERVLTSKEIVGSDGALTQVGTSLEFMKEQWELINDKAGGYYDAVQSGVEIQKLQLKYQDAINKSNDPKVQKALKDQMEEQLGLLRSMTDERTGQVILSEYQVERANKLLELTQKQYALEDSRANRNQMKLRRDTQGNYSYVYTANQDDIVSRQSDLLDAQSNLYDFDKERAIEVQESAINTVMDYLNRMSELYNERMNATGEKAEEITRQIEFLQREYEDYLTRHIGELSEAQANLAQSLLALMQDLYDNNKQGLNETVDKVVENTAEGLAEIDERVGETFINFDNLQSQFGDDNETFLDLLEDNFYDFTKEIEKNAEKTAQAVDNISESIYEAGSATDDLTNSTGEFFDVLVNQVGSLDTYKEGLEEAIDRMNKLDIANENLKSAIQKLQNDYAQAQQTIKAQDATIRSKDNQIKELQNKLNGGSSGGSSGSSSGRSGSSGSRGSSGGSSGSSSRSGGSGSSYAPVKNIAPTPQYARRNNGSTGGSVFNSLKRKLGAFDTGGYTGNFNDPQGAGRLAILHSKELVLNKEDTINILEAVKTIRSMTENMRNAAFSDSIRLLNDAGADIMTNFATAQQLDQDVHIDATFPNVRDAREIEIAMNNLIDQAAQFIHRNN